MKFTLWSDSIFNIANVIAYLSWCLILFKYKIKLNIVEKYFKIVINKYQSKFVVKIETFNSIHLK